MGRHDVLQRLGGRRRLLLRRPGPAEPPGADGTTKDRDDVRDKYFDGPDYWDIVRLEHPEHDWYDDEHNRVYGEESNNESYDSL